MFYNKVRVGQYKTEIKSEDIHLLDNKGKVLFYGEDSSFQKEENSYVRLTEQKENNTTVYIELKRENLRSLYYKVEIERDDWDFNNNEVSYIKYIDENDEQQILEDISIKPGDLIDIPDIKEIKEIGLKSEYINNYIFSIEEDILLKIDEKKILFKVKKFQNVFMGETSYYNWNIYLK